MDVNRLPSIEKCKKTFQSLAILDAILMPEWELRYYSFNSKWDTNQMMASMRDGSGEHYFGLFDQQGLIIKGFEQASKLDKDLFSKVPIEFAGFLKEPAFKIEDTTFCLWNLLSEGIWHFGKEYDPNELYLLNILVEGAEGYKKWADEYYETIVSLDTVIDVFNFKPLTEKMVSSLNTKLIFRDIHEDVLEIGYPISE